MPRSSNGTTRAERRERKRRKRMPVSGRHVFTLQRLSARPNARPKKKRA